MQLAASQRAHPPPVPPRPSRQVVAEALKKSPRPPCPTRQAPPPPNQQPWRPPATNAEPHHNNHRHSSTATTATGRTIVYDSAKHEVNGTAEVKTRDSTAVLVVPSKRTTVSTPISIKPEQQEPCNNNSIKENNNVVKVVELPDAVEESPPQQRNNNNVSFKEESCGSSDASGSSPISRRSSGSQAGITSPPTTTTVVVIEDSSSSTTGSTTSSDNIQTQDWLEAGVRYSSTKIVLPAEEDQQRQHPDGQEEQQHQQYQYQAQRGDKREFGDLDFSSIIERIAMSSLQGLPPLPRSLSGFNLNGAGLMESPPPVVARTASRTGSQRNSIPRTPSSSSQGSRPSPQGRQLTTLDTQLAVLRREMFGLRQLDLSLLSQLWSLNESIQEFRQLLQDQEDRAPSPSPSSDDGDDTSYSGGGPPPSQPPPPPRRPAPAAPHHLQQYHHRPHLMRTSSRGSKLSPSDESPSSEEYGAV